MPDIELKRAYKIFKNTESDDIVIDAAKERYVEEIDEVKEFSKEIYEKLFKPEKIKKPASVPTTTAEQMEINIKETSPNAVNSIMRPKLSNEIEKPSNIFKDMRYSYTIDKIKAKKVFNNHQNLCLTGDFFDKTIGVNYQDKNLISNWNSGIEYEPMHNGVKAYTNYRVHGQNYGVSIYTGKNNTGISAFAKYQLNSHSNIQVNVSSYKNDSAFKIEYQKKGDENITAGVYGSTKYKEVGVLFRLTTF